MKVFLIAGIAFLLAVTGVQLWMTQDTNQSAQQVDDAIGQSQVQIGGAFTLTDQDGKTVQDTDFRGKVMLVFFGFTHCPNICPVTVTTLSNTLQSLGAKADQVSVLFITVDPERDTPEVLKHYLSNFDKHMVGLTGTQEQITQVEAAYKAYAARAEGVSQGEAADAAKDYTMDHSAYIYLMDQQGTYRKIFPYTSTERELMRSVESLLK